MPERLPAVGSTWVLVPGPSPKIKSEASSSLAPSQCACLPKWVTNVPAGNGTLLSGSKFVPLPAGTFVTHFGKQVHWDGAKDEDASLLIFGEGPGTSTQVEPTAGNLSGIDPKAVTYTLPDQYKWRDPTGAAGVNQVVLHGDPTKSGPYVVLNRFKPGNFSKPHFHPNDRFITVVKGTWWVATGNKVDRENTAPMPAGSFVTHFGKQVHWDGAKDEEAWVLIVGEGPGTLTLVEEASPTR